MLSGEVREVKLPDLYSADMRSRIHGKLRQLPDDKIGVLVVATVEAHRMDDYGFLVWHPQCPLSAEPGFEKVSAIAWVHITRRVTGGTKLLSGLYRYMVCWLNPNATHRLGESEGRELASAFGLEYRE